MQNLGMLDLSYRITRRPVLWGAAVVWSLWLALMVVTDGWHLFRSGWFMSVTMAFGSFIAGATSEGGGAVAFPVMTLGFGIAPAVARDFSLLIQSVGMMAAAFTIYCLRVPVERRAILWAGLGGAVGVALGLDVVAPLLPPAFTKLFFVSLWLSFAAALYRINRDRDRAVRPAIDGFGPVHALLLFGTGVAGGTVSGITGSGLDVATFALLVLAFRIDERVATPTSVVLMGMNALAGVLWREGVTTGMAAEAWGYWWVCVPVVVIGAPLGARFIRGRSRHFVAGFLYVSIAVQYVAALLIIPMTPLRLAFSAGILAAGLLFFFALWNMGHRREASLLA